MKRNRNNSLFDRTLLRQSLRASFQKLDPRKMVTNVESIKKMIPYK